MNEDAADVSNWANAFGDGDTPEFIVIKNEPEEHDEFEGGEITPEINLQETANCANCWIQQNSLERKNFHEFFSFGDGENIDVRLIDALAEIFKMDEVNLRKLRARDDLFLCSKCLNVLSQLYGMYNRFRELCHCEGLLFKACKHKKRSSSVHRNLRNSKALNVKCDVDVDLENEGVEAYESVETDGVSGNKRKKRLRKNALITGSGGRESGSSLLKRRKCSGVIKIRKSSQRLYKNTKKLLTKDDDEENYDDVSNSTDTSNLGIVDSDSKSANLSFNCPEPGCKLKCRGKKALQRHLKTHSTRLKPGDCDRCGKKFKTFGGLKVHYAAHIRDDSKFVCRECGKKFSKQEALEYHEKIDHGGYKPHRCEYCQKTFRLKDKLKLHILVIHEKKKPFPCDKCEKSFRTKYHLKIHDVAQHIHGENSIGCSQCKRKFPNREALEKHVLVHETEKPFKCDSCDKGFQTSARLKLHEKSHQAVPSCLCPICGRAYKHMRDLRLHEVIHQDESTYRFGCGDCPRRFYRIDLLRVHQSNEKHFSAETIGPTVAKQMSTRDRSLTNQKDSTSMDQALLDEEDEDDQYSEIRENQGYLALNKQQGNNRRVSKKTKFHHLHLPHLAESHVTGPRMEPRDGPPATLYVSQQSRDQRQYILQHSGGFQIQAIPSNPSTSIEYGQTIYNATQSPSSEPNIALDLNLMNSFVQNSA